jgi:hypothetical protein
MVGFIDMLNNTDQSLSSLRPNKSKISKKDFGQKGLLTCLLFFERAFDGKPSRKVFLNRKKYWNVLY